MVDPPQSEQLFFAVTAVFGAVVVKGIHLLLTNWQIAFVSFDSHSGLVLYKLQNCISVNIEVGFLD